MASEIVRTSSSVDVSGLGPHVGAVDRKTGNDFAQRFVQLMAGVVAVAPVALAYFDEKRGEAIDVAAQDLAHDQMFLVASHRRKIGQVRR